MWRVPQNSLLCCAYPSLDAVRWPRAAHLLGLCLTPLSAREVSLLALLTSGPSSDISVEAQCFLAQHAPVPVFHPQI